jgi:type IV pilus assembly protein PilQ
VRVATELSKEKRMPSHLMFFRGAALAAALFAAAPGARAAIAARVTSLEDQGGKLIIHATAAPEFTVFKLSGPPRVIIDLNGADVTAAAKQVEVHRGGIAGWSAAQFDEGQTRVGRIVVALEGDAKYDVSPSGNDVVLTVGENAAAGARAGAAGTRAAGLAPQADPNLVTTREDARSVTNPAHKLAGVAVAETNGAATIRVAADGEIASYTLTELKNPGRLALDLHGVSGRAAKAPGAGLVKGVRVAKHDDGMRVVVDADGATMPKYDIARRANGIEIRVGEEKIAAAPKPAAQPEAKVATAQPEARGLKPEAKAPEARGLRPEAKALEARGPKPEASKTQAIPALTPIRAVDLRTVEGRTEVLVALEDAVRFEISRPDATTTMLTLHGAGLPDRLERNLDTSSLGGPVSMLSSYRVPAVAGDVKVVATVAKGTPDEMTAQKGTLIWKFGGPKTVVQQSSTTPAPRAAAMASEARAGTPQANVYDTSQYTGRKVDFNVKDIDIKNLLGAIADISKKNIIVADDVKGTVTIKLRNVPWDQALDIILKSKGLGREEVGNIIRVAPIDTLRNEQRLAAEAYKNRQATEPLKVRLIPVNYAKASELQPQIKDALTDRGTVSVDTRTNTMIVKDVQEALLRAEGIVRNLDTQTPEVLIEARIVEAATSFARSAGIQWGGNVIMAPTFGNPTGLIFPNLLAVAGAADDSSAPISGLQGVTTTNFAVNMPAPIGLNNGAGLGFVFGSAGGAANLNLRLSAYENSGTIKTISSPRVVTVDNVDASISQGVSIPFSQTSAAGVSTTFVEARLELRVTPHVTQEGSIQMKINATNNQPNPGLTGSNGQPAITRREAKTDVLVRDGETTVIGGIYTRRNSEAWNEVPVLSKIPILGWLFKKKAVQDDRTELLIFVTPRIVNRSQSVVAAAPGAGDEGKQ